MPRYIYSAFQLHEATFLKSASERSHAEDAPGMVMPPAALSKVKPEKRGPPPGLFELGIAKRDIVYTHPLFMQCFLPVRHNARNDQSWKMENGKASVLIRAGVLLDPDQPGVFKQCSVPAGPKGRLLMAYINDYILRHRTRVIPLGDSLRKGMALVGVPIGGKNAKELQREIENLATAEIVLGTWNAKGNAHQNQAKVASDISFWSDRDNNQSSLWQSEMTVSAEYYQAIMNGGMAPAYWPAMIGLQHNARAMDIHSFLVYRLHTPLKRSVKLDPKDLHALFGQDIALLRDFWVRFQPALLAAHKWYPTARIELIKNRGGLLLRNSPALIPYQKAPRIN